MDQAEEDGVLAEKVGMRPDIPPQLFRDLLLKATEVVQQRLLAAAKPETQAEIRRVLAEVSNEVGTATSRDYCRRAASVEALRQQGKLNEAALVDFANAGQYEETVAALSRLCVGPDRCGRPPDGRRPSGPDPDPLQVRGLGVADRQGADHGAARQQGRVLGQASTPPSPISSGCRRRPRSA